MRKKEKEVETVKPEKISDAQKAYRKGIEYLAEHNPIQYEARKEELEAKYKAIK